MKPTNFGVGVSRRAIMGSALAMPFLHIGPARAAEFNYKLATGQSLTQPINPRLEQARTFLSPLTFSLPLPLPCIIAPSDAGSHLSHSFGIRCSAFDVWCLPPTFPFPHPP